MQGHAERHLAIGPGTGVAAFDNRDHFALLIDDGSAAIAGVGRHAGDDHHAIAAVGVLPLGDQPNFAADSAPQCFVATRQSADRSHDVAFLGRLLGELDRPRRGWYLFDLNQGQIAVVIAVDHFALHGLAGRQIFLVVAVHLVAIPPWEEDLDVVLPVNDVFVGDDEPFLRVKQPAATVGTVTLAIVPEHDPDGPAGAVLVELLVRQLGGAAAGGVASF